MSNRHSENKTRITALAARNMAEGLRLIATEYERLAKAMEKSGPETVEAGGLITGMDGLVKVSKFCGSIQEAFCVNTSLESVSEIAGAATELKRRIYRLKEEVDEAVKEVSAIKTAGDEAAVGIRQKAAEKHNRKKAGNQ